MEYKWRKSYEIGIKIVDDQHKHLFDMIAQMIDTPYHQRPNVNKDFINGIFEYTKQHFKTEEKLMKELSYPDDLIQEHHAEHANMIKEIESQIMHHYTDGVIFGAAVLDFMKDWIINHLLGDDQDFADWARENGKI